MQDTNVLFMCLSSFIAVFIVLTALAIVMRGLIAIFPFKEEKKEDDDSETLAAINSVYAVNFPNWKITNIKEVTRR